MKNLTDIEKKVNRYAMLLNRYTFNKCEETKCECNSIAMKFEEKNNQSIILHESFFAFDEFWKKHYSKCQELTDKFMLKQIAFNKKLKKHLAYPDGLTRNCIYLHFKKLIKSGRGSELVKQHTTFFPENPNTTIESIINLIDN